MDEFLGIFYSILPPFILLGIGALARGLGWLKSEADSSLSMITVRILYPCFIFFHIIDSETSFDSSTFITASFGFITILLGFVLSWLVAFVFRIDEDTAPTFRFCSGIFNYGFIAIPVAIAIFDKDIVVQIILFNLGVEIAIWTIGILILSGQKFTLNGVFNPPAISVLVALLVEAMGGQKLIPFFTWNVIESCAMCSIPVGLMLIGASFYKLLSSFHFSRGLKVEMGSVVVRNFLFPTIVLLYVYMGYIPEGILFLGEVLVVQAAMPAGIFAIVIVGNYFGDKDTAMRSIIVTMFASILTLPLWIMLGFSILEKNKF